MGIQKNSQAVSPLNTFVLGKEKNLKRRRRRRRRIRKTRKGKRRRRRTLKIKMILRN